MAGGEFSFYPGKLTTRAHKLCPNQPIMVYCRSNRDDRVMLVRFLSFIASIIGTARYKALFLSSLALSVSLTGITIVALTKDTAHPHTASSSLEQPKDAFTIQQAAPQLASIGKQNVKQPETQDQTASPETVVTNDTSAQSQNLTNDNTTTAPTASIALSKASVMLVPGGESESILATTSDKSSVTWAVESNNTNVRVTPGTGTATEFSFQITADKNAVSGNYQLTILAKDVNRNASLPPKTVSITIP